MSANSANYQLSVALSATKLAAKLSVLSYIVLQFNTDKKCKENSKFTKLTIITNKNCHYDIPHLVIITTNTYLFWETEKHITRLKSPQLRSYRPFQWHKFLPGCQVYFSDTVSHISNYWACFSPMTLNSDWWPWPINCSREYPSEPAYQISRSKVI